MGAEREVARRGQQAPPGPGVSVGAGAEGGVQALGAEAGGERPAGGEAVLSDLFQGLGSGAHQVGGGGQRAGGRGQTQEVGKHQVFFAQQSTLIVSSGTLGATQQLEEFYGTHQTRCFTDNVQTGGGVGGGLQDED